MTSWNCNNRLDHVTDDVHMKGVVPMSSSRTMGILQMSVIKKRSRDKEQWNTRFFGNYLWRRSVLLVLTMLARSKRPHQAMIKAEQNSKRMLLPGDLLIGPEEVGAKTNYVTQSWQETS